MNENPSKGPNCPLMGKAAKQVEFAWAPKNQSGMKSMQDSTVMRIAGSKVPPPPAMPTPRATRLSEVRNRFGQAVQAKPWLIGPPVYQPTQSFGQVGQAKPRLIGPPVYRPPQSCGVQLLKATGARAVGHIGQPASGRPPIMSRAVQLMQGKNWISDEENLANGNRQAAIMLQERELEIARSLQECRGVTRKSAIFAEAGEGNGPDRFEQSVDAQIKFFHKEMSEG